MSTAIIVHYHLFSNSVATEQRAFIPVNSTVYHVDVFMNLY